MRFAKRSDRQRFVRACKMRGATTGDVLLHAARRYTELAEREQPELFG